MNHPGVYRQRDSYCAATRVAAPASGSASWPRPMAAARIVFRVMAECHVAVLTALDRPTRTFENAHN